jgi:hypothetical protein
MVSNLFVGCDANQDGTNGKDLQLPAPAIESTSSPPIASSSKDDVAKAGSGNLGKSGSIGGEQSQLQPTADSSHKTPAKPKDAGFGEKQLKGVLRTLQTLSEGEYIAVTINGHVYEFYMEESVQKGVSSMSKTFHFMVRGRELVKLYWFSQFAAITTPSHVYVEFCAFSNGDVCVGVWETRCNRPFHAILIYLKAKQKCELFTCHNHRAIFPNVVLDPNGTFDMVEVEK